MWECARDVKRAPTKPKTVTTTSNPVQVHDDWDNMQLQPTSTAALWRPLVNVSELKTNRPNDLEWLNLDL